MALKIRSGTPNTTNYSNGNKVVFEYNPVKTDIPNLPFGVPHAGLPVYTYAALKPIKIPVPPAIEMPESKLPQAINYYADYGGCGFWRMIWPQYILNGNQKAVVTGLTTMVLEPHFYRNIKSIRVQRQATQTQRDFVNALKQLSDNNPQNGFEKFQLIYEIDDIVYKDDIPDYNRCKEAFTDSTIEQCITEIMQTVDEITVTCPYMKKYYQEKTGNKNITVIPNYPPKFWLDRFYDREKVLKRFEQYKRKPRILYSGSGTHLDVMNRPNMIDDFTHIKTAIIKARKKFTFVWKGCYPIEMKPFIDNGEMEYFDWSMLMDYPQGLADTNCNAVFAPLTDNIFNRSKSNIKMVESGGLGLPGVFQDLDPYYNADLKFISGDDLINQLEVLTKDEDTFMKYSDTSRKFVEGLWLEDHINEYLALYTTPYGSKERASIAPNLVALNPDQFNIV